jgi:hypothetical protein
MRNLLLNIDDHLTDFSDAVYNQYMKDRFGVTMKSSSVEYSTACLRKDIINWLINEDWDALTQVSVNAMSWLPVSYYNIRTSAVGGCSTSSEQCSISMAYPYYSNTSQNIIEVNAGGCMTRINVNPLITISTSSKYEHTQSTAATVWTINHNLGFIPNVYTINGSGQEIEGKVTPVNTNTITITFSDPVSGVAYLS